MFSRVLVLFCVLAVAFAGRLPVEFIEWQGRVVGGTIANNGQFPHMVSLRPVISNTHFCGGAMISTRWVLSAAHCTIERFPSNLRLALGSNSITGGTLYNVLQVINHASYNPTTFANDISVIQSTTTMSGNWISSRPLSTSTAVLSGVAVIVSGWGQTSQPGSHSSQLLFVSKTTVSNSECATRIGSLGTIIDSKICAFTGQNDAGACMGDSGGPLTQNNSAQTILGVLSWGVSCARGFPDVYTRVSWFRTWITTNTGI